MRCRQRHRGPVVVVTQAAGGAQRLHHDMPLLADFPCCDIPARAGDSKYPPLQWQQRAAKVAVQRAAAHGPWLQVLLCLDIAHLPELCTRVFNCQCMLLPTAPGCRYRKSSSKQSKLYAATGHYSRLLLKRYNHVLLCLDIPHGTRLSTRVFHRHCTHSTWSCV